MIGREQVRTLMPNGAVSHRSAEGSSQQKRAHNGLVAGLNAAEFTLPPLHRASQNTSLNTASTGAEKPRSHRAQLGAADDLAGTWTKGPVRLSTSWLLIRHGTLSTFLKRVITRRQTRPFTVKIKSRRKPTEISIPDTRWGRLIDDPAPDELPSRDVNRGASGDRR